MDRRQARFPNEELETGIELIRYGVDQALKYTGIKTYDFHVKQFKQFLAEKMITLGKNGGLHCRRQASSFIMDEKVSKKVFTELAPRYAERAGGYTRIIKLGPRLGDGAPTVQLELVE